MTTPDRLAAAAVVLFGERWQRPLAHLLGVDARLVRWWASGDRPIPEWVWPRLEAALTEKREAIDEALAHGSASSRIAPKP